MQARMGLILAVIFVLSMTLAVLLLLTTVGVVRLPPRPTAVLPYLFFWSLFAMIATTLMIGLSAWTTLSARGRWGGGYSPKSAFQNPLSGPSGCGH